MFLLKHHKCRLVYWRQVCLHSITLKYSTEAVVVGIFVKVKFRVSVTRQAVFHHFSALHMHRHETWAIPKAKIPIMFYLL